jgi:integrase
VEVIWLFEALEGTPRLMAELMFGSGVRLMELLRLRVKDVDLERGQLIVRGGKGGQDQVGTDIRTVKKPGMGVRSPLDSS